MERPMLDERLTDDWSVVVEYEDDELEPAERLRVMAELLAVGVMRMRRQKKKLGQHPQREFSALEDVESRGLDRSLEPSTPPTWSTARETKTESGHG